MFSSVYEFTQYSFIFSLVFTALTLITGLIMFQSAISKVIISISFSNYVTWSLFYLGHACKPNWRAWLAFSCLGNEQPRCFIKFSSSYFSFIKLMGKIITCSTMRLTLTMQNTSTASLAWVTSAKLSVSICVLYIVVDRALKPGPGPGRALDVRPKPGPGRSLQKPVPGTGP